MAGPELRKLYHSIGEVCRLTGLEAHVLRFWENEFPQLVPHKTEGGTRKYRHEDIELIREIGRLVHDEKYTLEGARRQLRKRDSLRSLDREALLAELRELLNMIDQSGRGAVR
ncbi:MAG: MerR family transcriptional regulator [Calditrichaeota bacterium]|nr:MerR family transcriptional regulator [Candidatus Cloacimonadota bacterium]MCA9787819.1 MerR family transcriptional regulator [Candidatus Cloacimonadota bacterium]MCB1047256.1 MerR family transcriptional regulator [Calditrichota bacterium]MCB9473051.1 MerR family transcriptional regulator [Candidatus Delongbacteria bacterium]